MAPPRTEAEVEASKKAAEYLRGLANETQSKDQAGRNFSGAGAGKQKLKEQEVQSWQERKDID